MSLALTIPIGVVVSRETVEHSWPATRWRVAEVLLDPPPDAGWRKLAGGVAPAPRYHAATLPLCLLAKDAASYHVNISNGVPSIYVISRDSGHASGPPLTVRHVSVSPFEAQALASNGMDLVESIAMPERLLSIVSRFVEDARSCEATAASSWRWSELPSMGAVQVAK